MRTCSAASASAAKPTAPTDSTTTCAPCPWSPGPPTRNCTPAAGTWLAEDRDDQHLLVAIVDTAHLVVTMALQLPDLKVARLAAEVAAAAAPQEQTPKGDLIAVAQAEGDTGRASRGIDDLLRQRDADGPIEPDPRTTELVRTRAWADRPRPQTRQARVPD